MARCKECLHYKVCAKEGRLVQVDEHTWDEYNKLDDVEQFCTNYFTADVVPKSEVEKYITAAKIANKEYEKVLNHYLIDTKMGNGTPLQRAKADISREIFAEIKKAISGMTYNARTQRKTIRVEELKEQVDWVLHEVVPNKIEEIEKKYTEGDNENRLVELLKNSHSEWLKKEYDHETDKNINEYVADYLLANGVIVPHKVTDCDFSFEYGVVVYKHRFSINRSLDDYEETTLSKCISMGVQYKYKTMAKDKLIAEMQILYKDENDKLHCLCEDLHDYTFEIKHKGNMRIYL